VNSLYVTLSPEDAQTFIFAGGNSQNSNLKEVEWKIDYKIIEIKEEIGRGSSGVVFLGKWRLVDVAIKKLLATEITKKQVSSFLQEIEVMKKVKAHKNIVQFYGISCSPLNELCIGKKFLKISFFFFF